MQKEKERIVKYDSTDSPIPGRKKSFGIYYLIPAVYCIFTQQA